MGLKAVSRKVSYAALKVVTSSPGMTWGLVSDGEPHLPQVPELEPAFLQAPQRCLCLRSPGPEHCISGEQAASRVPEDLVETPPQDKLSVCGLGKSMATLRTAALSSENEGDGQDDLCSHPCRRLSYEMGGGSCLAEDQRASCCVKHSLISLMSSPRPR